MADDPAIVMPIVWAPPLANRPATERGRSRHHPYTVVVQTVQPPPSVRPPRPPLANRGATITPSVGPAFATIVCMADPAPPAVRDMLGHALESAQRLAIDVIEYPADRRDEVMRRMGVLLTEVAQEAGCTHEMALEFGDAMEQTIRSYVSEIEASGGGTVGTA